MNDRQAQPGAITFPKPWIYMAFTAGFGLIQIPAFPNPFNITVAVFAVAATAFIFGMWLGNRMTLMTKDE